MKSGWRSYLWICCLLLPFQQGAAEEVKLRIVTTFFPVYCFVANVAGEHAVVENLLPAGAGPHDFQSSRSTLQKLRSADLVFMNGLGLEDWAQKIFRTEKVPSSRIKVISRGIPKELLLDSVPELELHDEAGHDHKHEGPNPHIWLDPQLAAHCVTNILSDLEKADPARADQYRENAEKFLAQLASLDAECKKTLAGKEKVPMVTYHNSFPYFIRRYGLNLVGVLEETPDIEPSPRYLSRLMKTLREENVRVIFVEPNAPVKLARQIAADLKIETATLDPLESGPMDRGAYLAAMRKNLQTLSSRLKP